MRILRRDKEQLESRHKTNYRIPSKKLYLSSLTPKIKASALQHNTTQHNTIQFNSIYYYNFTPPTTKQDKKHN